MVLAGVKPPNLPLRAILQRTMQSRSLYELRPGAHNHQHALGLSQFSHPSSAKLTYPSPATITWSKMGKSNNSPALQRDRVSSRSDALGRGFPEGWLCTSTMAAARMARARPKTILGSTTVPVRPPLEMQTSANTSLDRFKSMIQNSSCCKSDNLD